MLFTEAIWISMEALTIVMGAIGVHEFAAFMHLLSGGESGNESKVALSKWGFGQLVAVCVWVPVILKFACLMVGKLKSLSYPSKSVFIADKWKTGLCLVGESGWANSSRLRSAKKTTQMEIMLLWKLCFHPGRPKGARRMKLGGVL